MDINNSKKKASKILNKLIHDPKFLIKIIMLVILAKIDRRFARTWPNIDDVRGWLFREEAYLLFKAAQICQPPSSIVEIGSYEGRSTAALANGAKSTVEIFAIDPHTGDKTEVESGQKIDTFEAFLNNMKNYPHVVPIRQFSVDAVSIVKLKIQNVGLLFIDGWHSEEAVSEDIKSWIPLCAPQTTVIFDDWYKPEVRQGILKNLELLPPVVGNVGKDLVFSNDRRLTSTLLFRIIYRTTPQSILGTFTPI